MPTGPGTGGRYRRGGVGAPGQQRAHLARLEARIAGERLLEMTPVVSLEPVHPSTVWTSSEFASTCHSVAAGVSVSRQDRWAITGSIGDSVGCPLVIPLASMLLG